MNRNPRLALATQRSQSVRALAYVYFEEEPGRRSVAKLLTKRRGAADCGEYRQAARIIVRAAQEYAWRVKGTVADLQHKKFWPRRHRFAAARAQFAMTI
jgi:hypothetical protein